MVQTINLAHMPPELCVHAALYSDLQNAAFLKEQLIMGNAEFQYAFIDASMILSTKHVLAAAFRAMNDFLNDRLKSKLIHSEIVFALSPNNNISEALRKFGVAENTKSLIVLKVSTTPEITIDSVRTHLQKVIEGNEIAFEDCSFENISDLGKIKKAYKLGVNFTPQGGKAQKSMVNGDSSLTITRDEREELETSVLGSMALRGAT